MENRITPEDTNQIPFSTSMELNGNKPLLLTEWQIDHMTENQLQNAMDQLVDQLVIPTGPISAQQYAIPAKLNDINQ